MAHSLIAIVGTGVTGQSVARYLRAQNTPFIWVDTRAQVAHLEQLKAEFAGQSIGFGKQALKQLKAVPEIVVSPGVKLTEDWLAQLVEEGASVISDIELFCRGYRGEIVAITGSNAKSTVTELTGQMLTGLGTVFVGGNIGVPVLSPEAFESDIAVLELSSFQLERTYSLQAKAATILNVSEDHIDHHGTMGNYIAAKSRICDGAEFCLQPFDQQHLFTSYADKTFGVRVGDVQVDGLTISRQGQPWLSLKAAALKGEHNGLNAAAAAVLAAQLGASTDSIQQAIDTFKPLAHRCEFVARIDGVDYINDSKGTNPGATVAAIEGFGRQYAGIYLIAGGEGKGASFATLLAPVKQYVSTLYLFGADASQMAAELQEGAPVVLCSSLEDAVSKASDDAQDNCLVMLSPACASFDMFENYQDRGDQFKQLVREVCNAN